MRSVLSQGNHISSKFILGQLLPTPFPNQCLFFTQTKTVPVPGQPFHCFPKIRSLYYLETSALNLVHHAFTAAGPSPCSGHQAIGLGA